MDAGTRCTPAHEVLEHADEVVRGSADDGADEVLELHLVDDVVHVHHEDLQEVVPGAVGYPPADLLKHARTVSLKLVLQHNQTPTSTPTRLTTLKSSLCVHPFGCGCVPTETETGECCTEH